MNPHSTCDVIAILIDLDAALSSAHGLHVPAFAVTHHISEKTVRRHISRLSQLGRTSHYDDTTRTHHYDAGVTALFADNL